MKILIPMGGKGVRFNRYLPLKPLLELDGKPMIEHVVDYFPRDSEFIFVCHEQHLETTDVKKILNRIAPNCTIVTINDTYMKGPAYGSQVAFDKIADDEEVIVNYCDFIQEWDFEDFQKKIKEKQPDGAIISFKGFHPASLGDTYYCYMQVDQNNYITAIREKQSFQEDRMADYASTGTYYFKTGAQFKKYVKELIADDANAVKGEFYMSLPFIFMLRDNLKVLNYELPKFICLGTPRDYELYKFWSEFFLKHSPNFITFDERNLNVTNIFPLAGGERDFKPVGFNNLNFMLPVMNKPLIHYSFHSNPKGVRNIFIGLEEHKEEFLKIPLFHQPNAELHFLKEKKNGNAETILQTKSLINPESPVCVSGATYILDYNERKIAHLMEHLEIDIILFSFSHHECVLRDPNAYAYAKIKNNIEVTEIIEKQPISDNPYNDQALTGTAIFRRSADLFEAIEEEKKKHPDKKLYYLSCLNNIIPKRKVVIFEVDKIVPIRTLTNYKEFVYWQDYFDKRAYHPYQKMLQ